MPVVGAAFLERIEVGGIGLRPVGLARLAIAAHTIALDIAQVLGKRLRAGSVLIEQQRLDGHTPRHGRELRPAKRRRGPRPKREPGRWPEPALLLLPPGRRTADLPLLALPACLSTLETKLWPRFFGALGRMRKSSSRRSVMAVLLQVLACPGVRSTRTCPHRRGLRASRGTAAKPACRATPCRLAFDAARCRVLSCLPPLPLAGAPGSGPAVLREQPARRRTRRRP